MYNNKKLNNNNINYFIIIIINLHPPMKQYTSDNSHPIRVFWY